MIHILTRTWNQLTPTHKVILHWSTQWFGCPELQVSNVIWKFSRTHYLNVSRWRTGVGHLPLAVNLIEIQPNRVLTGDLTDHNILVYHIQTPNSPRSLLYKGPIKVRHRIPDVLTNLKLHLVLT